MLASLRHAEPEDPPVLAAAMAAQQLLLKPIALDHRYKHRRPAGRPQGVASERARVVQDIEVPIDRTVEFRVDWFLRTCRSSRSGCVRCGCASPCRRAPICTGHPWPLYPSWILAHLCQRRLLVRGPGHPDQPGYANRQIEKRVAELDGHKSLYSESVLPARRSSRSCTAGSATAVESQIRSPVPTVGPLPKAVKSQ